MWEWAKTYSPFFKRTNIIKTFIIGGGNSITDETYKTLESCEDKFVFCVNTTFKSIDPDALTWIDSDVYVKNKEQIDKLDCLKYTRYNPICENKDIQFIEPTDDITLGLPHAYCGLKNRGWFSGVCAISIALSLGHDDIYLLGFDGGYYNGKLHHHEDSRNKDVFSITLYQYEPFRGKPITNLNPDSHITVFKKDELKNVIY